MSKQFHIGLFGLLFTLAWQYCRADEPNETFEQSTVLSSGILSFNDTLTGGFVEAPDTYLGTLGFFGDIQYEDDDSSEYGNGYASGLTGIPINPGGTIDFLVTGCCDYFFSGDHFYSGDFEVIIDVFDFFGDYVETVTDIRTLQPGVVEQFNFSGDETWLDGFYNINIDNQVGPLSGGDVDFYTFTGLDPGAGFSAEVTQEFSDLDSVLGWFDENGLVIETDDDDGEGTLSLIEGIVPASGELTFAVSGYDDFDFLGQHDWNANYSLELTLEDVGAGGDFDNDGDVDGRDFLTWQRNPGVGNLGDWQAYYGTGGLNALAVPEPGAMVLVAACGLAFIMRR